jgi:hypothetical protein
MMITGKTRGLKYLSEDKRSKADTKEMLSDNAKVMVLTLEGRWSNIESGNDGGRELCGRRLRHGYVSKSNAGVTSQHGDFFFGNLSKDVKL